MDKLTQNERILTYIEKHGGITPFEALRKLGVMRLASRISDLKKQGYPITGKLVKFKNRYGETCRVKRYTLQEGYFKNELCKESD